MAPLLLFQRFPDYAARLSDNIQFVQNLYPFSEGHEGEGKSEP